MNAIHVQLAPEQTLPEFVDRWAQYDTCLFKALKESGKTAGRYEREIRMFTGSGRVYTAVWKLGSGLQNKEVFDEMKEAGDTVIVRIESRLCGKPEHVPPALINSILSLDARNAGALITCPTHSLVRLEKLIHADGDTALCELLAEPMPRHPENKQKKGGKLSVSDNPAVPSYCGVFTVNGNLYIVEYDEYRSIVNPAVFTEMENAADTAAEYVVCRTAYGYAMPPADLALRLLNLNEENKNALVFACTSREGYLAL